MRKLYVLIILFGVLTSLSSCVDIEEHYNFKADGSCNVVYDFDMSHAVAVLMNLMSDSVAATPQFAMAKDTSLNFYNALPDTTQQKLSAEETKLAKSSNLDIKMNLRKSLMKISINHEAKDAADLKYYIEHINRVANTSQLSSVTKGNKNIKGFDAAQMIVGQDYYDYEITPHKFYRIIDKTKFNNFLKKTQATFVMAKALLIETPYKLILNFAKPVKKINNSKAIVSADRKTVTLVTNMDEVIKNPSLMNLKIDF
ncbi:hypothetical protein [Mucilaginibacter polytrichastri]|uniref:Uncharacterized protein n=1 Tax=Mucilaginibacter polytrichastri TaxID=1302689 RepID=A0A1Q5ZW37_9SPHI|nr:hypothetical protein [Mucilaginibacter polytrichastri]OKS85985.1 hypothetical protein RG47T_1432 [Mucilaginibacter polytrichastri]SFS59963.1 hypothetical protein SAMN04487890_102151 [Mucilaginibacter polytrichastri]